MFFIVGVMLSLMLSCTSAPEKRVEHELSSGSSVGDTLEPEQGSDKLRHVLDCLRPAQLPAQLDAQVPLPRISNKSDGTCSIASKPPQIIFEAPKSVATTIQSIKATHEAAKELGKDIAAPSSPCGVCCRRRNPNSNSPTNGSEKV